MAPEERRAKPSLGSYILWVAMIVTILSFSAFLVWSEITSGGGYQDSIFKIMLGFAGAAIAIKMAVDLSKAIRGRPTPKQLSLTLLKCSDCGLKSEREFEAGDFVGKVFEKACRKCDGPVEVDLIYTKSQAK